MPVALDELRTVMDKKRAFIVTDTYLYHNGYTRPVTEKLDQLGIINTVFANVQPDPTLANAEEGAKVMNDFQPDVIIALGGGSAMDAAKIMWVLYEHPEVDFQDLAMRFMDIRKRVYTFPKMGEKAYFIAIPTTSGTGSEVTPFAVITEQNSGVKYPLADYELLPNMAIVDVDNMMTQTPGLTSAGGLDALTHALEAYASMMATDYTDGLAPCAIFLSICRLLIMMVIICWRGRKWRTLPVWPVWHLPMLFWVFAIPWRISWVLFIIYRMVWRMPC